MQWSWADFSIPNLQQCSFTCKLYQCCWIQLYYYYFIIIQHCLVEAIKWPLVTQSSQCTINFMLIRSQACQAVTLEWGTRAQFPGFRDCETYFWLHLFHSTHSSFGWDRLQLAAITTWARRFFSYVSISYLLKYLGVKYFLLTPTCCCLL